MLFAAEVPLRGLDRDVSEEKPESGFKGDRE
jgi:hypothetical protein